MISTILNRWSILIYLLVCVVTLTPITVTGQCHPSPNFSTMDRDFLEFLKSNTKQGNQIAILPFFDNHSGLPDDELFHGLPFFLYDAFSPEQPYMIHPYVSQAALTQLGINGAALATQEAAAKIATELKARFVIFGSFQLTFRKTIMVHINVYDAKTNQSLSPAEAFERDYNDALFDLIAEHTMKAFARTKSAPNLKRSSTRTANLDAFRAYGQGMFLGGQYNQAQLEQAEIWLEKALKISFHNYSSAALGLARVQFMQALIQKLNKQSYSLNYNKALQNLPHIKDDIKDKSLMKTLTYRYIAAQESSAQALTALAANQKELSVDHAEEGLRLVPEDGMLQNLFLGQGTAKNSKDFKIENAICF